MTLSSATLLSELVAGKSQYTQLCAGPVSFHHVFLLSAFTKTTPFLHKMQTLITLCWVYSVDAFC